MSATAELAPRAGFIVRRRPGLLAGLVLLSLMVGVAAFAGFIAPDPFTQHLSQRRIAPVWHAWLWDDPRAGWTHPLGTDKVGRDSWARIAWGARISLVIGFGAALASTVLGAAIGVAAGFWGGAVDLAASFLIQARLALPVMLVALAAIFVLGGSVASMTAVLSVLLWDRAAIMTRSATMQLREREFIQAAEAVGSSSWRIIAREILPNLFAGLAVIFSLELGNAVLSEAALSFLGLGIRPPSPSWGLLLAEAKEDIFFAPWTIAIPGAALFLLVLATSLIGDGLAEARAQR